MKTGVIRTSGLLNCWSAAKVFNQCVGCDRYDTCTYPDRRRDLEYDALVRDSKEAHKAWQDAIDRIKQYTDKV
jgi:hypothetical protein